jgi:hypothetical protein
VRRLVARLAAWAASLSPRERALVAGALVLTGLLAAAGIVQAVRDDLGALRARVAGHERDLREVRRLALALGHGGVPTFAGSDEPASVIAMFEAAADGVVGRERLASLAPTTGPAEDGVVEERVTARVTGASLAETVRLLHALEAMADVGVTRLELRKHPDDPGRFEATVDVARLRATP